WVGVAYRLCGRGKSSFDARRITPARDVDPNGAGREPHRTIRQVLLESLVLASSGGLLGLLLSFWTKGVLVNAAQISLPITSVGDSSGRVLVFTFVLSLLTALVFGLFPSLQASQTDVIGGLREGGRSQTSGKKQGRTLSALVTAQFALALVLLIGAGLLLRSFSRLLATNPGFRPDHILTMSVSLPANAYESGSQVRSFYERVQQSTKVVPGVKETAIATSLPLSVNEHRTFSIEGQLPQTINIPREVAHIWSMGGFFRAMGIPLQGGRFFDFRDSRQSLPVAIVNETLARRFWPGQNAIGKRIKWGENGSTNPNPWMTIVGIVKDVKQGALDQAVEPETYTPYEQVKDEDLSDNVTGEFRSLKIVVRTSGDPLAETSAIKRQIGLLDASLPITDVATMEARLSDSTRSQRFNTLLLGIFAAAAVILAALGIAGVLAYSVAQRIPEIGLRLALGARKADVLKLVMVRGMRMAFTGTLIGVVFSLALSSVMASFLYDVSRYDAWTFLAAPCFLCAIALVSIWIPARRAAAVDPIQALRAE
ncbi:MAG: ABC transporter permease, partial [Acidobacteriota bacterium]|nr:ABC transporter permease [Acidobacteriota bacterium]